MVPIPVLLAAAAVAGASVFLALRALFYGVCDVLEGDDP